jgi:DNA-binding CsgD family transcriptional regulator
MPASQQDRNHLVLSALTDQYRDASFLIDEEWMAIIDVLKLSEREAQIINYVLTDDSEQMIATRIGISPHTVHSHLERLYRKLDVHSRCQVAVVVFKTFVALTRTQQCSCGK